MGSGKDPAVLFYTSDFLSGCALMDMRERGQYITLLCLQRERGHMTMQEITRAVKKPSDEEQISAGRRGKILQPPYGAGDRKTRRSLSASEREYRQTME